MKKSIPNLRQTPNVVPYNIVTPITPKNASINIEIFTLFTGQPIKRVFLCKKNGRKING